MVLKQIGMTNGMTTITNNQHSELEVPADKSAGIVPELEILNQLKSLALDEASINERQKQILNAKHILGKLALKGQITVLFAGPNTGKTLICLKLLSDAFHQGLLNEDVYHINLDDDYTGATTKAKLGLDNGFRVIIPEKFSHPLENFRELINLLVKSGAADKTIFILDTIKKFADVMDKKAMSAFITECRKLTSAGGSIIALAHTNKITNDESKVVPGGTSDLLDDCDCAYVLYISNVDKTDEGLRHYVTFEQRKARGPSVHEALYSYVVNDDGDYSRLFDSVRNESPEAVEQSKKLAQIKKDQSEHADLIQAIQSILGHGEAAQTAIINGVKLVTSASRNDVKKCLKRWNIPEDEGGLWKARPGNNNATLYKPY